jgi:ATP-dependent Clp protease adaptor protein ClpS
MSDTKTATPTDTQKQVRPGKPKPRQQPPYPVSLLDDDDHTFEYVIEMLGALFGHTVEQAFLMAKEVNATGRAIVDTTTLERAELKRDQIHAYGPDKRSEGSKGSMSSKIEPAV